MTAAQLRMVGLLIAAVVVFGSGVWLTRSGRPFGIALMTVHKLVDLGAVIVVALMVYGAHQAAPLSSVEWLVVAAAAVFVVAAFATGGIVSAGETAPGWVLWTHRIGSWFAGALAAAAVYVVGRR